LDGEAAKLANNLKFYTTWAKADSWHTALSIESSVEMC